MPYDPDPPLDPLRPVAVLAGLLAAIGTIVAALLTGAAIELSIRHDLDFLRTVDEHAGLFVAAAVVTAAVQPLVVTLVAGMWAAIGNTGPFVLGAALVGIGAALQLASAGVNVVLGADIAGDAVVAGDAGLGVAVHDIADALYFIANSVTGLAVATLGIASPWRTLRLLGIVAAGANLAVYVAFAVEALWWIGAVGVLSTAAWWSAAAIGLRAAAE